jgi:uncharacterized protein YgfB (UPF0149 family)
LLRLDVFSEYTNAHCVPLSPIPVLQQVQELQQTIEDLEQLQQVSEELEENHAEVEKQLRTALCMQPPPGHPL